MKLRQSLAAALLTAILAASVSCGAGASSSASQTTASSDTDQTAAETTAADTVTTALTDGLPDTDLGGANFNMITTSWYNAKTFIYADELNGEVVNDALFNCRSAVETRFDVKITMADGGDLDPLKSKVDKLAMAGDTSYDVVYNHDLNTVAGALKNDFSDLKAITQFDFTKPWWTGSTKTFEVGGKLLFTASDLAVSGIYMNYILAINKDLAAANGIEIPYDKVSAGQWYLDDLIAMNQNMNRDINGDGKFDENDQYGFLTSYYGEMGMQSDLGGTVLTKDDSGHLTFVDSSDRIYEIMVKSEKLFENGEHKLGEGNEYGMDLFKNGQGLFSFTEARVLYNDARDTSFAYGILPFPKYDDTQENYQSSGCDIYWAVIKPSAVHADIIGTCVEALSCQNYSSVVPAVWEMVLGAKLSDAPQDTKMFEIIRDAQYVDLGYAFSGQSAKLTDLIFLIDKTSSDKVASYIEARRDAVVTAIQKINDTVDGTES